MKEILTKYGLIKGISTADFYASGAIRECKLNEHNEINTELGTFVPQYEDDGLRRKYIKSMSFYENGNLQSISLQKQTVINTSFGPMLAELITFHENGNIRRVFPVNGKISAYWTELNEYDMAGEIEFNFKFAKFKKKVIGINFYASGTIKSITFWTKDNVSVNTEAGEILCRIGISLYADGNLKSCEPLKPTVVKTPIGNITAYDVTAVGINGDKNSLNFYEDGRIKSLYTSTDKIEIKGKNGEIKTFQPKLKPSILSENAMDVIPYEIQFSEGKVRFCNSVENEFEIDNYEFNISKFSVNITDATNSCSGECGECGECG